MADPEKKGLIAEFKEFIMRGNVMDLAVGVIIGGAFGAIVTGLVDNIIKPLINSIGGSEVAGSVVLPWVNTEGMDEEALAAVSINYGAFISAIINFLIIALIIFILVKAINKAMAIVKKEEEPVEEEPTTKTCPYCKSEIDIEATKCPHCTSDVE
ncbi:MAG TPA: large conductance mechanosensitive channel protein MscL [Ruminococcaceae bacterium]|nr:large conductance mechanosensitive channel protein MscL [Oscillospiraceae bacterium]